MTRGNDTTTKVFYRGKADDFVIFVDDVTTAQKWRHDRTVPLAQVVSGWKVFVTHR
jgi:Shwachman-Bodian-Diamond syndrome (SBDS) protein